MYDHRKLIDKLNDTKHISKEEWTYLIEGDYDRSYLYETANEVCVNNYGKDVYIRGLIEVSNYCRNDCYYCGIRKSNCEVKRYHLKKEDILSCAKTGYELGFRTFVMQGGEDLSYSTSDIADIVAGIKDLYPDCAVTLSLGEKEKSDYKIWKDAGADRYLLRHETASKSHYEKLHPKELSFDNRMKCLIDLKDLGFQVGAGFMVGSPYQTTENLIEDMLFLAEFKPQMVGIGPFIPAKNTPFENEKAGDLKATLTMLSLIRLLLPDALIPATTALASISPEGRELGLKAGANVVMPNLSPADVRALYNLYDNKQSFGFEAAENLKALEKIVKNAGKQIVVSRGDFKANIVK